MKPLSTPRPFGPYSKKYMSLSHIVKQPPLPGARFDLTVHPILYNGGNPVPNVTFPCGWHPWQAAADGSFFSALFDTDLRLSVQTEVSYFEIDETSWGFCTAFKNKSKLPQNLLINHFAGITYPTARLVRPLLPTGSVCKRALYYDTLSFATPRPWDHLTPDGLRRGQIVDAAFCEGSGVGAGAAHPQRPDILTDGPGKEKGDTLSLTLTLKKSMEAVLCVRYRTTGDAAVSFETPYGALTLPSAKALSLAYFPMGALPKGDCILTLTATGAPCGVEFDFFALVPKGKEKEVGVQEVEADYVPSLEELAPGTLRLTYPGVKERYTLRVLSPRVRLREVKSGCLEDALLARLSNADPTFDDLQNPFTASFSRKQSDPGHYTDLLAADIYLPAGACCRVYGVLSVAEVPAFDEKQLEAIFLEKKKAAKMPKINPDGKRYKKSARLLRSALLTNVVYPQSLLGEQIIHHTPGKRWDCFYTWDSGFIGLGISGIHPPTAEGILRTYLSEETNTDFAFLHHGSVVPVQFYLFWKLLQQAEDQPAQAENWYQALRRYYRFLLGEEGSTMAKFKTGLLTNYDYFYNASGMDDYPAQVLMHSRKLSPHTAPVLLTAHAIRAAKMLLSAARLCGNTGDIPGYEQDIQRLSAGLQGAWEEKSGYFGYTVHNPDGSKKELLTTDSGMNATSGKNADSGENANCGMDGVMALLSGECTKEQTQRLLENIFDTKRMFTPCGITAVDQSASYYRDNGYWNGAVWFSHQWFLWCCMLDLGAGDRAWQIASTALTAWKKECDSTLNTFEMLHVATGRGGWFHQFGGLSAPVLLWLGCYYQPGVVNAGLDTRLYHVHFAKKNTHCTLCADTTLSKEPSTLVVSLAAVHGDYRVQIDQKTAPHVRRTQGAVEILLPPGKERVFIEVERA